MSDEKEIKHIAIQLLSRREHSMKELRRKLLDKSFSLVAVDDVLTRLKVEGWQSDSRFAEAYVRMRTNNGFGPIRILQELKERGVDESLFADLLDYDDSIWFEKAVSVYVKKFGEGVSDDYTIVAKQKRFLQYRGFTKEQIKYAMSQKGLVAAEDDEQE